MAEPELMTSARRTLETDRDDLRTRIDELGAGTDDSLSYDENFADSGQVAAEQGENAALASQLRDQLGDVESALTKLDDGSYGRCEVCQQAIGDARLEAMPATRFCIQHA